MKKKEFDNILDECLERILTRGETIEQCLESYPEQSAELEPLLQTALLTKRASAIKPRPEFRERARYQLRSALQEMEEKRERRSFFFGWQPRWATAVIAVLVFLMASGGTVAAAGNSMPDEPLYPVKLATETVQLTLTPSALGKAELYVKLADKRVVEIIRMADKGKMKHVERTAQRLNNYLVMAANLAAPEAVPEEVLAPTPEAVPEEVLAPPVAEEPPEKEAGVVMAPAPPAVEEAPVPPGQVKVDRRARLRQVVARRAIEHPAALREVLQKVPESAQPALLRAIDASDAEYEKILNALRGRKGD
ncbi:hypothetical protein ES703_82226 [subsurface metagenome]